MTRYPDWGVCASELKTPTWIPAVTIWCSTYPIQDQESENEVNKEWKGDWITHFSRNPGLVVAGKMLLIVKREKGVTMIIASRSLGQSEKDVRNRQPSCRLEVSCWRLKKKWKISVTSEYHMGESEDFHPFHLLWGISGEEERPVGPQLSFYKIVLPCFINLSLLFPEGVRYSQVDPPAISSVNASSLKRTRSISCVTGQLTTEACLASVAVGSNGTSKNLYLIIWQACLPNLPVSVQRCYL